MKIRLATATILAAMGLAQTAAAQDAGEWIVRSGFHSIAPKSRNHALVKVDIDVAKKVAINHILAVCLGHLHEEIVGA
jgi:outer membrane protein W